MTPRYIVVRVEELVVTGFPPGQGESIGAALEAELGRLLRDRGVPEGLGWGGACASAPAAPVRTSPDTAPERVGERAAGSVYGALGR